MQRLELPVALDITSDAWIAAAQAFAFDDHLVIDAGGLTRTDAAGLQVLVAVVAAAKRAGGRVEWREPSAALVGAAGTLGLGAALGLAQGKG